MQLMQPQAYKSVDGAIRGIVKDARLMTRLYIIYSICAQDMVSCTQDTAHTRRGHVSTFFTVAQDGPGYNTVNFTRPYREFRFPGRIIDSSQSDPQ